MGSNPTLSAIISVRNNRVTFYLQADRPRDPDEARNWLPVAHGDTFQLAARFYEPMAPLVDGSYPMPQIERAALPSAL